MLCLKPIYSIVLVLHEHKYAYIYIYIHDILYVFSHQEEPIVGFRFQDYLTFMEELECRYGNTVLADMKSLTRPLA